MRGNRWLLVAVAALILSFTLSACLPGPTAITPGKTSPQLSTDAPLHLRRRHIAHHAPHRCRDALFTSSLGSSHTRHTSRS